jgi:exodeoxyribonuclease-3
MWKAATFNVNGIRARKDHVLSWLDQHRPDALCLQETKCQDPDFPAAVFEEAGYQVVFRGQKAYNGVAVLTRSKPERVWTAFGDDGPEREARFLAVRVDGLVLINTYVPQGQTPDAPAFQSKLEFLGRVQNFLDGFQPDQPLIWTGDLNVAPQAIDVFDPDRLDGQTGFHPEERERLARVMDWGLTDLYRHLHPETQAFSFWDYRLPKSHQRNLGWRLDHFMVTRPLVDRARECWIDDPVRGWTKPSDHAPVYAEFDL